ncbi:MAG: hypothetical protein ABSE20_15600 [Acetobacteraceae bacterium]|jgi:hypothetical protein
MNSMMKNVYSLSVDRICDMDWSDLTEQEFIDVAWAYYFFSIQFRENLTVACTLFPHDSKLQQLEHEECATDNLSPWPGVAAQGEKMNHDDFMWRLLQLTPISDEKRRAFEAEGARYLDEVRAMDDLTRALSIASYEDGGLERVFRAFLQAPERNNPALKAFRHFLSEHIRFDNDPDQGHGALSRHLAPDDRILPLWLGFERLLISFVPTLRT